jgi:hypothetical protein
MSADTKPSPLSEFAIGLANSTREHVKRKIAEAVAPLEQRIKELESRPRGLVFKGVWTSGTEYGSGDVVSQSGCMWICTAASTRQRPGDARSRDWTLSVKAGRDAR